MPNDNDKLRGLWLHFDETVDADCEKCKGTGNPPPDPDSHLLIYHCCRCFGSGKRRVRVRGAVEVNWGTHYISDNNVEVRWHYIGLTTYGGLVELRDAVITAFLADELPGDVAKHIEKEDVDNG